jgi:hypothetical protein
MSLKIIHKVTTPMLVQKKRDVRTEVIKLKNEPENPATIKIHSFTPGQLPTATKPTTATKADPTMISHADMSCFLRKLILHLLVCWAIQEVRPKHSEITAEYRLCPL